MDVRPILFRILLVDDQTYSLMLRKVANKVNANEKKLHAMKAIVNTHTDVVRKRVTAFLRSVDCLILLLTPILLVIMDKNWCRCQGCVAHRFFFLLYPSCG